MSDLQSANTSQAQITEADREEMRTFVALLDKEFPEEAFEYMKALNKVQTLDDLEKHPVSSTEQFDE